MQGLFAGIDFDRVVGQSLFQRGVVCLVGDNDAIGLKTNGLICQCFPMSMGGEGHHLEQIGMGRHNVEGLCPRSNRSSPE